ncbi:hypothetical protein ACPWSR_09035 [Alloiococcus sp. CFN-8]|uniref:hypothetical protein n=1 Tax=Alloiococcus sp. CFN-8 TaxID=3416081 RepID=UPI003CF1B7DB
MNQDHKFPMRYKDRYILKLKEYYIIGWFRSEVRADAYEAKDSYMSLEAYQALLQDFDAKPIPMIGESKLTDIQELREVSCFISLENCKMAIDYLENLYNCREINHEEELLKQELRHSEIKKEDLLKAMDQMLLDEELEKELLQQEEDELNYYVDLTEEDIEEYLNQLQKDPDSTTTEDNNTKGKKTDKDDEI